MSADNSSEETVKPLSDADENMAISLAERPFRTFLMSALAAVIATWMFSLMMARQTAVLHILQPSCLFGSG